MTSVVVASQALGWPAATVICVISICVAAVLICLFSVDNQT
jgi:hypothetical protein